MRLQILQKNDSYILNKTVAVTTYQVQLEWKRKSICAILGVDPGQVNMGLAYIQPDNLATLWQIAMPSQTSPVDRIILSSQVVQELLGFEHWSGTGAVVEYAAFGAPYGQPSLAEARAGAIMGLMNVGISPHLIQTPVPMQIRKRVFGSAKTKAEDYWPALETRKKINGKTGKHSDAASALACALSYEPLYKKDGKFNASPIP